MTRDHLWAPWRLEYIKQQGDKKGCPFCSITQSPPSEENLILFQNDKIFVVLNKFPYNPGHLLVLPVGHQGEISDLAPGVWELIARAAAESIAILKDVMGPQGFNVGLNLGARAGAGIPEHLHWHVVPRWSGDTNFMPILAETKAIPAHNVTVYRQLKDGFANFAERLK